MKYRKCKLMLHLAVISLLTNFYYKKIKITAISMLIYKWASTLENLSSGFANNTGADQPAHPRRLISAFVIRLSRSIMSRIATSEISIFYLVSVAEESGSKLTLTETPKTGFLGTRPKYILGIC